MIDDEVLEELRCVNRKIQRIQIWKVALVASVCVLLLCAGVLASGKVGAFTGCRQSMKLLLSPLEAAYMALTPGEWSRVL